MQGINGKFPIWSDNWHQHHIFAPKSLTSLKTQSPKYIRLGFWPRKKARGARSPTRTVQTLGSYELTGNCKECANSSSACIPALSQSQVETFAPNVLWSREVLLWSHKIRLYRLLTPLWERSRSYALLCFKGFEESWLKLFKVRALSHPCKVHDFPSWNTKSIAITIRYCDNRILWQSDIVTNHFLWQF